MFTIYRDHTMQTSILRFVIAGLACLLVLGAVGCNDAKLRGLNNEEAEQTDDTQDQEEDEEQIEHRPVDEHGHGTTEEEQDLLEPGYMNGSWRAATDEQDQPAVYFDTFQDEGNPEVTGTYLMGFAIYEHLDGESGNIDSASFDGDQLTIRWNPTNDSEEVYTLQASRVDEDTLEGQVTAKRNPELDLPVTLTRMKAE